MEKERFIMPESDNNKTIALVMFVAGILVWFLVDSSKPLAHDLLKAIGFFLFGYGLISLMKWKSWGMLSSNEKKMRVLFYAIIGLILLFTALFVLFRN